MAFLRALYWALCFSYSTPNLSLTNYKISTLDAIHQSIETLQNCTTDVKSWMTANGKLQLNNNKTEAIIILSNRVSLVHSPLPSVIHIGDADVPFVSSVKNLDVTLDSNLSMSQDTSNTCKAAYIQIRHVSSIRHLLTTQATQTLVCSLVLSRLDYCNSTFRLPSVLTRQTSKKFKMHQQGLCVKLRNLTTSILFLNLCIGYQ